MITDTDVKKLKGVFATKTDLKRFATKTDLERFATKADLDRFGTRVEFNKLEKHIDRLDQTTTRVAEKVSNIDVRVGNLEENMVTKDDLQNAVSVILDSVDKVAKGMDIMKHEYTAIGLQLDRHINDKSVHVQ